MNTLTHERSVFFLMKYLTKTYRRVVAEDDPKKYEEEFNRMSEELAKKNPEIKDVPSNNRFCTFFTYEEEERIPETAKEKCEEDGIVFHCKDCPHLELGNDKRRKHWPCMFTEYGQANIESTACDLFYRQFMSGKIKPRGEKKL